MMVKPKKLSSGVDVFHHHYGEGIVIELLDKKGYKGDAMVSFGVFPEHVHVAQNKLTILDVDVPKYRKQKRK